MFNFIQEAMCKSINEVSNARMESFGENSVPRRFCRALNDRGIDIVLVAPVALWLILL